MSSETSTAYRLRVTGRREAAHDTMAFWLEKPAGFSFTPGQFLELTLRDPPYVDAEGNTRAFSIAGAPHEDFLMVATRLRESAFKRSLRSVGVGTQVQVEGPFGGFRLHNNLSRTAVLLAGGIGITPFRSMVLHASHEGIARPIVLFYANRRPEDAPFLAELQQCARRNPHFRLVACMSAPGLSHSDWSGEQGRIDEPLLSQHLQQAVSPVYYIAGPPAMVQAMRALLAERGVDEDDVRFEEFAGY